MDCIYTERHLPLFETESMNTLWKNRKKNMKMESPCIPFAQKETYWNGIHKFSLHKKKPVEMESLILPEQNDHN